MKNLKKVLSLALAFAMVLGLCIGAMAADTKTQNVTTLKDWADVTNKDAAQLLNAFNIMQGDGNGNFRPADPVTRAEAAKMIAVALWGGDDLKDWFTGDSTTFTDVKSTDWFAGYVNYAATTGIVAGRNATTFDPQGKVTGYELLKMTLTALGYDQDDEGLVGANWKIRTMALAMGSNGLADLTKDVKVTSWDAPLNRDNTAKVVANMINRTIVKYDRDGYIDETSTKTFGVQYLKLEEVPGILVANSYAAMPKDQYKNSETETVTGNFEVSDPDHYNSVLLPIVDGKYGTPIDVNTTSGLYDLGSYATAYKNNKTPISVAITPATVVTNPYAGTDSSTALTIGSNTSTAYTAVTKLDTDGNGKTNVTITVNYAAAISDVKAVIESETWGTVYQTGNVAWRDAYEDATTLPQSIKAIKFVTGAAAAKDDKVLTVESTNASKKTVTLGAALETVEGTNTRINDTDYYIDGVKYTNKVASSSNVTLGFGATGVFYTYPGSTNIVTAKISGGAETSVALLYDAGYTAESGTSAMGGGTNAAVMTVAAILPDGTKGTYTVTQYKTGTDAIKLNKKSEIDKVIGVNGDLKNLREHDDNGALANTNEANYLVEYYLDKDGNMIITAACKLDGTGIVNQEVKTTTTSVSVGNTSKFITSETVTFVQTSTNTAYTAEDWTVYVGRTVSYTVKAGGKVDIVLGAYNGIADAAIKYATVEAKDLVAATGVTEDFYYVIADHGQISADYDEFVVFDASAGKVITINVAHSSASGIDEGEFYTKYDGSTLTVEKFFNTDNDIKGYVTNFANDIVVVSGFGKENSGEYPFDIKGAYVVNDKTKFFVIGDEETSAKITAADVAVQGPTTEPAKSADGTKLSTPYQAIVVVDGGVATTVILFAEEQALETTISTGR